MFRPAECTQKTCTGCKNFFGALIPAAGLLFLLHLFNHTNLL